MDVKQTTVYLPQTGRPSKSTSDVSSIHIDLIIILKCRLKHTVKNALDAKRLIC